MLPRISPNALEARAENLRRMITEAGSRVCDNAGLSASIGWAMFPGDGRNAEELLGKADKYMYRMKRSHHATLRHPPAFEEMPASMLRVQ